MNRRSVLAAGGAVVFGSLSGCLGGETEGSDGYGEEPDDPPEERAIDTDSYETKPFYGFSVPLVPIDDALYWYQRQEARVVDARGEGQFRESHITGAALSPASEELDEDLVSDWSHSDLIVTYCDCPHQLAGILASQLMTAGFENVYAIDEGYLEWRERNYPTSGSNASLGLPAYQVHGIADAAHAGEFVWVSDTVADQHEIARIEPDGSYEMTLHFTGLEDDSVLTVAAPDYTLESTLTELTSDVVTA